jgi:hypothetical protein
MLHCKGTLERRRVQTYARPPLLIFENVDKPEKERKKTAIHGWYRYFKSYK